MVKLFKCLAVLGESAGRSCSVFIYCSLKSQNKVSPVFCNKCTDNLL